MNCSFWNKTRNANLKPRFDCISFDVTTHYHRILVEILLLLSTSKQGREILRAKKVYPIIQKLHLQEPSEDVQEAIERLVQLLARDEAYEAPAKTLDMGIEEVNEE